MNATIIESWPTEKTFNVRWLERKKADDARRVTGTESLALFEARSKSRHAKFKEYLSRRDREKIACALYLEIERLEKQPALCRSTFRKADLAIRARLARKGDLSATKRLHELTIDPSLCGEKLAARRQSLCASHAKYLQLIHALLEFSSEAPSLICARIFTGTSFSGIETDINKNREIVRKLEGKIQRINRMMAEVSPGMTLLQCFRETAKLKEHRWTLGDYKNWPFFDFEELTSANQERGQPVNPFWSAAADHHSLSQAEDVYSPSVMSTDLNFHDVVLHLPRVYLGCAIYFYHWISDWEGCADHGEHLDGMLKSQCEIAEVRDLDTDVRSIRYKQPDAQHYGRHSSPSVAMEGEGHCWLVIYPSLDGKSLCPLLYWCQGEAGVHVCILDEENIDILSYFHVVDSKSLRVTNLFERLQALLGQGWCAVEREWARTAFDILDNPILRDAGAVPSRGG